MIISRILKFIKEAKGKAKEYFEISIMKSTMKNNTNYMHQYNIPFKERLKRQIKENDKNYWNLPFVSTTVNILIVMIKTIILVFKPFNIKKDKNIYYKKVYNNASCYAEIIEYTKIITFKNTLYNSNKCVSLKNFLNESNIMKLLT